MSEDFCIAEGEDFGPYSKQQAEDLYWESVDIEFHRAGEKHTDACIKSFRDWHNGNRVYKKKWPKHCSNCGGWGGMWSQFDPSPSGVSLGAGTMTDFDPCPKCVDLGICPRCGAKAFDPYSEVDVERCPVCDLSFAEPEDGLVADAPECWCKRDEEGW